MEQHGGSNNVNVNTKISIYGPVIIYVGGLFSTLALVIFVIFAVTHWSSLVSMSNSIVNWCITIVGIAVGIALFWFAVKAFLAFTHGIALFHRHITETRIEAQRNKYVLEKQDGYVVLLINGQPQVTVIPQDRHEERHVYNHPADKVTINEIKEPLQIAPPRSKPTIEQGVASVEPNSNQVCLGRSLQTGELIIVEIDESHLKFIGGTRMGKSCGAASILEQLRHTHDTRHMLFALLDLENKTSRLFADDPHVMTVDTGYKRIRMHAQTVSQVAESLICLHQVMEHRYSLSDSDLAQRPDVLIYVEEFLYWKRVLSQHVDKTTYEQAMIAFSGLSTRGLKAKLHLMACAQVDYRDEDLVEAMAQFIGINVAFAVKPSAAQAAGFVNGELLKQNYAARTPGQFVVDSIGGSDIGVAFDFDVKARLKMLAQQSQSLQDNEGLVSPMPELPLHETREKQVRNESRNDSDPALQAKVQQVMEIPGETMKDCLFRVWNVHPGNTEAYRSAKQEYMEIQEIIRTLAQQSMNSH